MASKLTLITERGHMKPSRISCFPGLFGFIVIGIVITAGVVCIGAAIQCSIKEAKICDWCWDKFYAEGNQLDIYWLDDRCYSELDKCAGVALNKTGTWSGGRFEQYDYERRHWKINILQKRNGGRK